MVRSTAVLLAWLTLATACSGSLAGVPFINRSSATEVSFPADATHASGELLAFDPTRHAMDIEIALPLSQDDDIEVFIITSNGIRFQILGSFQNCHVDATGRLCSRHLPRLPVEGVSNWRVEAERHEANGPTSLRVDVTWVPQS